MYSLGVLSPYENRSRMAISAERLGGTATYGPLYS